MLRGTCFFFFFFFNDTATTEIYTLSLHDALPISEVRIWLPFHAGLVVLRMAGSDTRILEVPAIRRTTRPDRKSTRLNSSHDQISYAVFCLKKKKTIQQRGATPTGHPPLAPA